VESAPLKDAGKELSGTGRSLEMMHDVKKNIIIGIKRYLFLDCSDMIIKIYRLYLNFFNQWLTTEFFLKGLKNDKQNRYN